MATLQPPPPFFFLPNETNYDYRSAGPLASHREAERRPQGRFRPGSDQEDRPDSSVAPPLSGWGDYHEYTRYSPSILVISDNSASLTQLTHWLETKGCQVYGLNLNSNTLASVSQIYFDLIIIELDAFETVLQKLKAYPGLSALPTIILSNCDELRPSNPVIGPLYCLSKGPSTEAFLLQIVAQIHYLSYRYI